VSDSHLGNYEPHIGGSATHVEYWIPAEHLLAFNASIQGTICVESAYFGAGFEGFVSDRCGLKGKDVANSSQWRRRGTTVGWILWARSRRIAGPSYLNFLFWAQFDFNAQALTPCKGIQRLHGSGKRGISIPLKYRFRRAAERKTPQRSA
jgi:hypothetical protein